MGIPIPDGLHAHHLAPKKLVKNVDPKRLSETVDTKKLSKNVDPKGVMRHIGNAAEQIETHSENVRMLSAQAKRLSRRLS
jgi:hypothetical protein